MAHLLGTGICIFSKAANDQCQCIKSSEKLQKYRKLESEDTKMYKKKKIKNQERLMGKI